MGKEFVVGEDWNKGEESYAWELDATITAFGRGAAFFEMLIS